MILLWTSLLVYFGVGCLEWWLALRRTLACARGETILLCTLVFSENLLGLFVLSQFIKSNDWTIAIAYSVGGALGALMVRWFDRRKKE